MELYKNKEWLKSNLHKTNKEIADEIGCSKSTIQHWMTKFELKRIDENELYKNKEWLQQKFIELKYAQTIGKLVGVSGDTIEYWRKKFDIKKENDNQGSRKDHFNQSFFENINSEEKAYWLGFIMADGCITDPHRLSICLKIDDIDHLEKFLKEIKSSYTIKTKVVNSNGHISEVCEVRLNSKKICYDLKKLGVTNNKTGKEAIPIIDKNLIRHFIRGFFDGDGCIYKYKKYYNLSFCSSSSLIIEQLNNIFLNLNINLCLEERECYAVPFYVIGTKKQSSVKFILDYLYKDSRIYLDRKYNIYTKIPDAPLCSDI